MPYEPIYGPTYDPAVASSGTVYDTDQLVVRTKLAWSAPWVTNGDLQPIRGGISAGNENQTGQMVFTRLYGDTKYPTEAAFSNRTAINLDNHWVQVLYPPYGSTDVLFQGRFLAEPRQINGNSGAGPSGIQTWIAYDGHTVLQRMEFFGSTGQATDHSSSTTVDVNVQHVLPFNISSTIGNRSAAKVTNVETGLDSYVFDVDSYDPTDPELWTARDVLEYLLGTRMNATGMPVWTASNGGLLDEIVDRFEFNSPVYNILDALKVIINRSYGVGFVVLPSANGFDIKLFGLLDTPTTFGNVTVPANTISHDIDINSSILDLGPVVERSFSDQYPEIMVIGKRMVVCASFDRSQLSPAWWQGAGSPETEYATPIGGLGPWTNEQLDRARRADKFRYVYQAWYVNPAEEQLPTPSSNDDGTIDTNTSYTSPVWGRETLPWLPMYDDKDYRFDPPDFRYGESFSHELIPPNVWMKDADDIYHAVDSKGIHLEVLPNQLGFRLNAPIPHYVALDDFDTGTAAGGTDIPPELTAAGMHCTLAWEADGRQFMRRLVPGGNRLDGRKVIYVDTDMWLIAPNTVIDVDYAGQLVKTPNAWMTVLDGKDEMERMMAGAVGRYTLARQRLTSRQQGLATRQNWLGDLIRVINDGTNVDNIRGPLTSINWVFTPHHLTVLKTGYGELNPGELSPIVIERARANQAQAKAKKP